MPFEFLTPQVFDALVIAVIVSGVLLAARRIYRDLHGDPRWPESVPAPEAEPTAPDTANPEHQQEE